MKILTKEKSGKPNQFTGLFPSPHLMRIALCCLLLTVTSFVAKVDIDLMLSVDLRRVPLADVLKMEDNRIMLPVQVNTEGEKLIEIVPHKAKAGYLTNYSDP